MMQKSYIKTRNTKNCPLMQWPWRPLKRPGTVLECGTLRVIDTIKVSYIVSYSIQLTNPHNIRIQYIIYSE